MSALWCFGVLLSASSGSLGSLDWRFSRFFFGYSFAPPPSFSGLFYSFVDSQTLRPYSYPPPPIIAKSEFCNRYRYSTRSTLTIGGSGISGTGALSVVSGELFLTVTASGSLTVTYNGNSNKYRRYSTN